MDTLPTIQMFWHGAALSRLERLCITSFLRHGHVVNLYAYEEPERVPSGVRLVDANRIIPHRDLFRHAKTGSIAPFADWFRYRLLHSQGGVWVDTDVVCLKPLSYPQAEIFGWEDETTINNAVIGLPAGHVLARWMAEACEHPNRALPYDDFRRRRRKWQRRLRRGDARAHTYWGEFGPEGFTLAVRHLGFSASALPFWHFYPVHYLNWRTVFDSSLAGNQSFIAESTALHLWNEMARRAPGFDKNARFPEDSLFEQLWARYCENVND